MTIAERLENKGMRRGESTFLVSLITEKFQQIPENYMEKIETASPELLLVWGKYLLSAKIIEDVFKVH
jgi:hypothetical protein